MSTQREILCIKCGKPFFVSEEEYTRKLAEPICPSCKQALQEVENEEAPDLFDEVIDHLKSRKPRNIPAMPEIIGKEVLSRTPTAQASPLMDKIKGFVQKAPAMVSMFCEPSTSGTAPAGWTYLGCLGDVYDNHPEILSQYRHSVGLYMHQINGQIMYIGRAVEYDNGGIRKRLSDYCRANDSARKHPSGQTIHAHRYEIDTYVLVVGSDEAAAEKSKILEAQYIRKYNPPWNDKLKSE